MTEERFRSENRYRAQRYWQLFVYRMDNMLWANATVHDKVEQALRRHYTYEEKPLLPRVRWRQKQKRKLPFQTNNSPFNWGYLIHESLHYQLNRTSTVIWNRKPGKIITQRYIEHLCKELGFYLA